MKLTALALCALLLVPGCARNTQASEPTPDPTLAATTDENSPGSPPEVPTATPNVDALDSSFGELSSAIPGEVGVAIATDGGVRSFGPWAGGVAWSTIKVPLAIAALRHSAEDASPLVPKAIRDSDNTAAEELWAQLGEPTQAAAAVEAVLKDGGDTATAVESKRKREEFTPFGQTNWSVVDQATFMAALPCLPESEPVISDMSNVARNQQWGLALRPDAATKGGWGPSPEGAYLVRQVATIMTENGNLGVALSALPQDGSFDTGVAQVGKLAKWVTEHLGEFTARKCSS
ncbi:MAG: hypothetical protein QG655_3817 [Actinomycetota bacterium]|nr:hypothetical protein [Actinomycetota bacterium]